MCRSSSRGRASVAISRYVPDASSATRPGARRPSCRHRGHRPERRGSVPRARWRSPSSSGRGRRPLPAGLPSGIRVPVTSNVPPSSHWNSRVRRPPLLLAAHEPDAQLVDGQPEILDLLVLEVGPAGHRRRPSSGPGRASGHRRPGRARPGCPWSTSTAPEPAWRLVMAVTASLVVDITVNTSSRPVKRQQAGDLGLGDHQTQVAGPPSRICFSAPTRTPSPVESMNETSLMSTMTNAPAPAR